MQRENASERNDREPDGDEVYELGLKGEQDAAGGGPEYERQLERDRALSQGAHENLLRNEGGRERATGRGAERAPRSRREREREEGPDLGRSSHGDDE
jgi:hypothetical protein